MKSFDFAVSIGSNVTSIYKAGVGVVLSDRSAVVTGIKGKHEIATYVGNDAILSGVEYRNVIQDGKIDFTLAELMLGEYFKRVELNKRNGVVFLVSFEDMALENDYKDMAYSLGINNVAVIPSIIATTYGFEIENFRKSYLIVDIGVNTEIAIVNYGRIVTGATLFNGGGSIDNRISEYILNEKSIELSRESAEKVKNEIATLISNDCRSITINGFIKDTTEYAEVTITSTDIYNIIVEEYNTIAMGILQILSSCDNELNQDIVKHGIYLCGASSKIVGLDKFFKSKLNLQSYIYKPDCITMVGAGQLLDNPVAIEKVIVENC